MRHALLLIGMFIFSGIHAQEMTNSTLGNIITRQADTVSGISGNWQFMYKETPMLCITDSANNRMRIIAPITEAANMDKDLLLDAMTANFHSALDVKYAISNNIVWSAYVHPLKELSTEQVESAISQVYLAAATFGTTFSSTELLFGAGALEKQNTKKEEKTAPTTIPEEETRKF